MQTAGSRSWRFAESAGQRSHVALFVRDAVGLDVAVEGIVPPALSGDVPDRRAVLDEEQRRAAGRQWPGWWRAVVDAEIDLDAGPRGADPQEWLRSMAADHAGPGTWPDFDALADRPDLRRAVRATFEEGARRAAADTREMPRGRFAWELVRDVAQDVAFDRQVDLDAVQGSVEVLAVAGVWWTPSAPGAVLCSIEATTDRTTAHAVLRRAFESGLSS